MKVWVCTWDPEHTLSRTEAARAALRDGVIAKLVEKHGRRGPALEKALAKKKLVATQKSIRGDIICRECGALCEEVHSRDGIDDKLEAVRDVAQDFDKALSRTRSKRMDAE